MSHHVVAALDRFGIGRAEGGWPGRSNGVGTKLGDDAPTCVLARYASDPWINGERPTEPVGMQAH